jgi:cobyrinic acid a,c-diamide synthase
MSDDQKKKEFAQLVPALRQELRDWYKEQVELEQAMTGASATGGGGGSSTNVWNVSTRMKSIQVIQSMVIVEQKLGFTIPEDEMPKLVKEGGYANFEEMENDLFPKLEKVYIAGGFPEKKKEKVKAE